MLQERFEIMEENLKQFNYASSVKYRKNVKEFLKELGSCVNTLDMCVNYCHNVYNKKMSETDLRNLNQNYFGKFFFN